MIILLQGLQIGPQFFTWVLLYEFSEWSNLRYQRLLWRYSECFSKVLMHYQQYHTYMLGVSAQKLNTTRHVAVLLLILLATLASCKSGHIKEHSKTVTENNHYFSDTQKKVEYNINSVQTNKALILILQNTKTKITKLANPVSITISLPSSTTECSFTKPKDMCIIPKVEGTQNNTSLTMTIQCSILPCDVQWIIYQPQIKDPSTKQPALNLFALQQTDYHVFGKISCNDPSITTFEQDVNLYSANSYNRYYRNNIIYALFTAEKDTYAWVDIAASSRACAQADFSNVDKIIKPQQQVQDFVVRQSPISLRFEQIPKNDFRLECVAIRLDKNTSEKLSLRLRLSLQAKDESSKTLSQVDIQSILTRSTDDFTVVFKQIKQTQGVIKLQVFVDTNQIVLMNMRLSEGPETYVQAGQSVFFGSKNSSFSFKISANKDAKDEEKTFLTTKRAQGLTLTKTQCKTKQLCQFFATAQDTDNMLYVSSKEISSSVLNSDGKGVYEFQEIQLVSIINKASRAIRMGSNIFFSKKVDKGKAIQVYVNNPNVILYAAMKTKCKFPDDQCRERTGNEHHPFIYEASQDGQLLINVEGLDNTIFQLTIVEENDKYIVLQDGTPFSYSMDPEEDKVDFKLQLHEKKDVSFNLVAPLNDLLMVAGNSEQSLDQDGAKQSADGYILIKKQDMRGRNFIISVKKAKKGPSYFTHFTLVASTKTTQLRLQPTITNYQTLQAKQSKDYIFEFNPSQQYIFSFYAYNLNNQPVDFQLTVFSNKDPNQSSVFSIDKQSDFLSLEDVSEDVCESQGVRSCQVSMQLRNKMQVQVDFTLTLLMRNAIIELKDGIWQALPTTQMMVTTRLYFYPRHSDKNILLYYYTPLTGIRVAYKLWKYSADQILTTQWPFPSVPPQSQQLHTKFNINNYLAIDHEKMKETCWPNCVLLMSFYADSDLKLQKINQEDISTMNFKIMVSNDQIELPEKQHLSFTVGTDEDKEVLVDLKYILSKQEVTFFTSTSIGQCSISANVYSETKPECPLDLNQSDFGLLWGQTSISVADIKSKLQLKQISNDNNLYLCINVHSWATCKGTIEYTTDIQEFKKLRSDSFDDIALDAGEEKYFELDGFIDANAKVVRKSGLPFIAIKNCKNKAQLSKCKQQFKASQDKGNQLLLKTAQFKSEQCQQCVYLFKMSTVEPAIMTIHIQSKYSEIQLKEKTILTDFLNQGEQNSYLIHSDPQEDLSININILEGQIQAIVTDLNQLNLNKKSSPNQTVLHFVIKANKNSKETNVASSFLNPLAMTEDLVYHHLTIKSTNSSKAATFTISYSSGQRQVNLQDGLILDYLLQPKHPYAFYYYNDAPDHIYLTVSTQNAAVLNKLQLTFYTLNNIMDKSSKTEIQADKPQISKKTPNPTLLFKLPSSNFFMFQIQNPTQTENKVSLVINHRQVILLPFNHEFPFTLESGTEEINFLIDVNIPGFLTLSIRKCDQSTPQLGYTFDYDSFIKKQFMYESQLSDLPFFSYTVKAQRIGTLYVNLAADYYFDSMLSIKVTFSQQKTKQTMLKPLRKGLIQYQLLDEMNARVSVPVISCQHPPCKDVKYYYMVSKNQRDLYSQLICPSSFFTYSQSVTHLDLHKITKTQSDTYFNFDFGLPDSVSFLGVKAVSESGQEYYFKPIQVATLLGKLSKTSFMYKLTIGGVFVCGILGLILCVRRYSRRGYKPLAEQTE